MRAPHLFRALFGVGVALEASVVALLLAGHLLAATVLNAIGILFILAGATFGWPV